MIHRLQGSEMIQSAILVTLLYVVLSASSRPKPHIILIVADDLGYNDVSFHGSDQIPTPNIDFLAHNGVLLNNYYVSPICTPTRSALLTGRHPIHTGMQSGVIVGTQPYGLPLNETLMSEHLNKLGYRSHIVGKWHLGMFQWPYTPLYRGFESHLGYYQGCEDYYDHTYEANKEQWGLDFRHDKEIMWNYTGKYSTDIFREEAVRIIKNHNQSEPLFLYLPFQAVHSSNGDGPHLQAPLAYINRFKYIENKQRRIYAGMVSALDDAVGTVYDTLKTTGLLENSIIVFTTDNGGPANGFDFNAASNFPLRGVKATLWEGGVRGVGLVHSPLLTQTGYVADQLLHVCDWLPTLYSAAGGDPKDLKDLDGVDAWKMLSSNGPAVRTEILHNIDPLSNQMAIRIGDFKLLAGRISRHWGGWYPPYQLEGDESLLHYSNFTDDVFTSKDTLGIREELNLNYHNYWHSDVNERLNFLQASDQNANSITSNRYDSLKLKFKPEDSHAEQTVSIGKKFARNSPVKIKCGEKPLNASTNCRPEKSPCLYNIKVDPCEYNNVAMSNPIVVQMLMLRLRTLGQSMVKPGNRNFDNEGNPKYHGGVWEPWR